MLRIARLRLRLRLRKIPGTFDIFLREQVISGSFFILNLNLNLNLAKIGIAGKEE